MASRPVALIAAADFALASEDAKFYVAFAGIGLVSDSGGSFFLPRRMGSRRATQFLMLNETLSAEEAARTGLINRVVALGRRWPRRPGLWPLNSLVVRRSSSARPGIF